MIGKIIGAIAGSKLAENSRNIGGPTGALMGAGAATIARRLSLPALAAITVGGYLVKRHLDKESGDVKAAPRATAKAPKVKPAKA